MTAAAPEPGEEGSDGAPPRGNGLTAARFVPLLDVDPRASEALLSALAAVGIAAGVQPRPPGDGSALDRLVVDEEHVEAARLVAERELRAQAAAGGPGDETDAGDTPLATPVTPAGAAERSPQRDASPDDLDAAWREIIAGYHDDAADPVPRWPVQEDLGPERPEPEPEPRATPRRRRTDRLDPAAAGVEPEAGDDPAERDHYRPPPAPPIGRPSRRTSWALAAIALGLALIVAPGVLTLGASTAVFTSGVLLLTGGVGALVLRMGDGPRTDDGPDDGAVV